MPYPPKPPVPTGVAHQLQLMDRSPVMTPAITACNSPVYGSSPADSYPSTPTPNSTHTNVYTNGVRSNYQSGSSTPRNHTSAHHVDTRTTIMYATSVLSNYPTQTIPELTLSVPLGVPIHAAPDLKGAYAGRISHCDRSPTQTGYNTRAGSPESTSWGRTVGSYMPKMHDTDQAGETVSELRKRMSGSESTKNDIR